MGERRKPSGRWEMALAGAAPVLLVVGYMTARLLLNLNAGGQLTPGFALGTVAVIAVITLGGLTFGWMRLEAARKERRNRPKPLDMN